MAALSPNLTARCACGSVVFEAKGAPIVSSICFCHSCQTGGRQIEQLPKAPKVLDVVGGTPYLLYRRDRVVCKKGSELLQEFMLKPDSPTRRMVAACCNSAMFLDFTKGHWLTMYRDRFPSGAPPIEVRIMTRDLPQGAQLSDDVPNYKTYPKRLILRLLGAKIAMVLHR